MDNEKKAPEEEKDKKTVGDAAPGVPDAEDKSKKKGKSGGEPDVSGS